MDVAKEEDVAVFLKLFDHHLSMIDSWMYLPLRIIPNPIQIHTRQIAPCATIDHTIGIEHGYNLEHKVVPKYLGIQTRPSQIVNDTLHDPASPALPRMDPTAQYDALSVLDGLRVALEGSHDDHFTIVARYCLGQGATSQAILTLGVGFEGVQVTSHVGVSIGVAMSQIHSVRVMVKLHTESQCIVIACILSFHRVLIVANVRAPSVPAAA